MKKVLLFAWGGMLGTAAFAQFTAPDVVAPAGTTFSNASGQLDWTMGEVVTNTFAAGTNVLTQGFHQPSLSFVTVHEEEAVQLEIYPNPSADFFTLRFNDLRKNVRIELYTAEGRLLRSMQAGPQDNGGSITIDMTAYAAAPYMLTVISGGRNIATYKLIKRTNN